MTGLLDAARAALAGSDGPTAADCPLPIHEAITLLSSPRRRLAVRILAEDDGPPGTIRGLTEAIAEREFGADYTSDERKAVYVGLYQVHLPELDEYDIVDWDRDRGTIQPGPALDGLYACLQDVDRRCIDATDTTADSADHSDAIHEH